MEKKRKKVTNVLGYSFIIEMVLRLRGGGKSDAIIKHQRNRVERLEADIQKLKKARVPMEGFKEECERHLFSLNSNIERNKKIERTNS